MQTNAGFTAKDIDGLSRFCEVCANIAACRFIREFAKQSHHVCVGRLPDGRILDEYPRYDDDDLRAFLTHYRMLRLSKEPTNLFRVIKLVKWKGCVDDRELLETFRREIVEEGKGWWGAVVAHESGRRLLTQTDVEDLILNGEVFHWEPTKRSELRKALGTVSLPKAIAFWNYLRFARVVVGCAQAVADLIQRREYAVPNKVDSMSTHRFSSSVVSDV